MPLPAQEPLDSAYSGDSFEYQVDHSPPDFSIGQASRSAWWGGGEYLLWWFKDAPVATPLVTAGPAVPNLAPTLGQPGQRVVLGGSDVALDPRSGARFQLGRWLDTEQVFGLEAGFFFLANDRTTQTVSSSGAPGSEFLALPFFDPTGPGESSTAIARPGVFSGTARLSNSSWLHGWEANGVGKVWESVGTKWEFLGGFRYLNLAESLAFDTSSPTLTPPVDVFETFDRFHTFNQFYGGQLGLRGEVTRGMWFFQGSGKLGIGSMREHVGADGLLATNDFNGLGATQFFSGGYLTQRTNLTERTRNEFALVPEVNLNLGLQLTNALRARAGYSFLYVTNVVRPGDQIDRVINPSQSPAMTSNPGSNLVGAARPTSLFNTTDFWAQGLNVSLELAF